jgi:hypothetical protein
MKALSASIAVAALAACTTPYQQDSLLNNGGYQDKLLDDGSYAVSVTVNNVTSRDTAVAYLDRRSGELCPAGYDTVERTNDEGVWFRRHRNEKTETAVIRCKDALPPPPGAAGAKTTHAALYCFTGDCTPDVDACERRRVEANAPGACEKTTAAFCTSLTVVADGSHRRVCMPDRDRCNARRNALVARQGFSDVGECYELLDDRAADDAVAAHSFYCAASPTDPELGTCDRDQATCTAARAKIGRDLAPCALAETADCFLDGGTPVCAPSPHGCGVARERHFEEDAGTGIPVGACHEAR